MKTLAKIIKRLLFGPSLEDYEARQKAENEKAVKAILADADKRERRGWDIIHKQAKMQSQLLQSYDVYWDDQYIGRTKNEPLVKY